MDTKKRRNVGRYRWITKWEVRHWRSKKMMRRKDGKPFRFRVPIKR